MQQRYNRAAVHNYCRNANYFLQHLSVRRITLKAITPDDVSNYMRFAIRRFRKRHVHPPARAGKLFRGRGVVSHTFPCWPMSPGDTGSWTAHWLEKRGQQVFTSGRLS